MDLSNLPVVATLIDQYRETFEGPPSGDMCWIIDGRPGSAIFGTIAPLTAEQALAEPTAGGKSIAAHVAHLRYSLDILHRRMLGEDPPADWPSSFHVAPSPDAWEREKRELRRAYDAVLSVLQEKRGTPVEQMLPIHVIGLCATVAHNAYHLGAIRQLVRSVTLR